LFEQKLHDSTRKDEKKKVKKKLKEINEIDDEKYFRFVFFFYKAPCVHHYRNRKINFERRKEKREVLKM
jgi:hypothetical protein